MYIHLETAEHWNRTIPRGKNFVSPKKTHSNYYKYPTAKAYI